MRISMLERGPAGARGLATFQQARVLRQMGLLEEATDTFQEALEDGIRSQDAELEGRAFQGLAAVAGQRGNFPEVIAFSKKALASLPNASPYAALGYGDLTIAYGRMRDFSAALENGWLGYDASAADVDCRAGIVCNMAGLALRCAQFDAARRGFIAALGLSQLGRIQLPALGGLALASAGVRDTVELGRITDMVSRAPAAAAHPYELAQARFELAQAWQEIGDLQKSTECLTGVRDLCTTHGFHEISFASEILADALEAARRNLVRDDRFNAAIARFGELPAHEHLLATV
jgi:tetratricopeptide (TPR) repeat protein